MERMLVAYDGSEGAEKALRRAVMLAESGDEIFLTAVVADAPTMAEYIDRWMSQSAVAKALEHVNEGLTEARRILALAEKKVAVNGFVRKGNAAEELIKAAREFGATLLLIGYRGESKIGPFPLGSITEKVVRHAQVPVIVVR